MNYRLINKEVMDDTFEHCQNDLTLKESIKKSIAESKVVYSEDQITFTHTGTKPMTKVFVTHARTIEAAQKYKNEHVAVLNFANNHSVGGAPWSAGSQEECLCRVSTLYPCLFAQRNSFYQKHIDAFENGKLDYMGNDDLMYIPGVTVFKTDSDIPNMLKQNDWFEVDVIVCAAPQIGDNVYKQSKYYELMRKRIKRIYDIAEQNHVTHLVLGAFGCGAFRNNPHVVATIMADLLSDYSFEIVEFAIKSDENEYNENYQAFKSAMEGINYGRIHNQER